ncbi:MAG: hypothetical protein HOY71_40220, partial [Nonomuraea sp.]|nr:hypothetical protein [Nonomuraea sp.]
LVTGSHVLPVLDGLDELPDEAQAKVIDALNLSLGDGDQLILTSRTREFREAVAATGDVLTSSATLAALPLEPDVVADYLRAGVPRVRAGAWRQVFAELDGDAPWAVLAEVTATPLGVWLLRTVYTAPGADPAELADHGRFPHASALRSHLFDRLAAALIATRPPAGKPYGDDPQEQLLPRRSYDADDVERWLGFLAGFLTEKAKTRDLAWWLLTTAVFNPPGAPFSWGTQNYIPGYYDNYPAPPGWAEANLVTIKLTLPGRVGALCRALAIGLSVALAGGALVAGFIGLLSGGWRVGVAVGTSFAVTFALPLALKDWAEIPVSTADPTTPTTSWRAARTAARFHRWVGVLAGGVTSALAFGVAFGWMPGLLIALPAGALAGRGIGFLTQYEDAWPKYTAVARRLARVHGFPRDLIGFLDDAHRLGLLRIVGPIYQFRHAEYHDHLAGRLLYRDP